MDFRNFTKGVKNSFSAILTKKIKTSKSSFSLKVLYSCILSLFLCLVLITGYNFLNINNDHENELSYADDNIVIYTDKAGNEYKLLGDGGDRDVVRRWNLTSNTATATPCAFEAILYNDGMVILRGEGTPYKYAQYWRNGTDTVTPTKVATATSGFKPSTCYQLFYNMENVESFDLSNLNTTGVTQFAQMFCYTSCNVTSPVTLDLTNLDTTQAVNDITTDYSNQMFYNSGFSEIIFGPKCTFKNWSSWYHMFRNSNKLTKLNLTYFDTTNVTNASMMFDGCESLSEITFGPNCTFSQCEDFSSMFSECSSLAQIVLSNFDTTSATNASKMFYKCSALNEIVFGPNCTFEQCENFSGMFINAGDENITKLVLDLTNFDTSKATNCSQMFEDSNFTEIKFGSKCTFSNTNSYNQMFYNCTRLEKVNTEMLNSPILQFTTNMFRECNSLKKIDLTNLNTINVTNASEMFSNCEALTEITFGLKCTFANCANFTKMFYRNKGLSKLELTNFDTNKVTCADQMFYHCEGLTELIFGSNCNFKECESFWGTFDFCINLTSLDLSMFDTQKLKRLRATFEGCYRLADIDYGNSFNTSNLEMIRYTYSGNFGLEKIDFDFIDDSIGTPNLVTFRNVFNDTYNTKIADLRKLDLSHLTDVSSVFNNDPTEDNYGTVYKNIYGKEPPSTSDAFIKLIYLPKATNNLANNIDLLGDTAYTLVDKYGCPVEVNGASKVDKLTCAYGTNGAVALVSDGGLELMDHILYEEDTNGDGTIDKEYWLLGTENLKVKARWNLFKPEESKGELITKPGKCEVILYEDGTLIYRGYDSSYKQQSVYVLPDWAKEYDGVVPTRIRMAYEGFKVNNMYYFFDGFKTITDIDLTNIDISDCSDFRYAFYGCRNLSKLNLSSLVFTKANPMFGGIFAGTEVIETIDISNFPAGSASAGMFKDSRVKYIILPEGFINSSTTNINEFFEYNNIYSGNPPRLESIDFSTCDFSGLTTYTENWTNSNIFKGSDTLKEIFIPLKNATIDIPLPQGTTNGYWQCLKEDGSLVSEQMYQTLQSKEEIPEAVKMVPAFCFASTIETDLEDVTSANQLLFTVKFNNTKPIKNAPDSVYDAIKVSADSNEIPKTDYSITQEDANTIDEHYNVTLQKSKVLSLNKSGSKVLKVEIANDTLEDVDGVKVVGTVKQITVTNTVPDDPKPITPDKPSITTNTITVQTIAHESYIDGYNDKTFKPNNNMTRAEFSKIIASISNNYSDSISNLSYNKKYQDMKDDNKWYSNYVGYVTKENLMQGDEKGFRPNDYITRAEVSKVLKNLFKINTMSNKEKETLSKFGNELNNKWYKDDMVSLITNGVMNGYPDGTVKPKNNITRAEIVSLINKLKGRNVNDNYKETIDKLSNKFKDVNKNNWYYYDVIEASVNH